MNLTQDQTSPFRPSSKNLADLSRMGIDSYRASTHQEVAGRIEYSVIDVIGHRLGMKVQLEHIQAMAVRKTIKNLINEQVNVAIKSRKANADDIRGTTELIRRMIMTYAETTNFKTMVRVDIGIAWETFKKELEEATVGDLFVQIISNVLHGKAVEETIQEVWI